MRVDAFHQAPRGRRSFLILNRDSILLGFAVLAILAFVFERDQVVTFSAAAMGSVLYLALFGTVFTFGVYLWLLRSVPAYRMSLTAFVTPVVALLVGALFGGEPLHAHARRNRVRARRRRAGARAARAALVTRERARTRG